MEDELKKNIGLTEFEDVELVVVEVVEQPVVDITKINKKSNIHVFFNREGF